ncbi:unnamed protein product [Clonostachys byssicola]|uniref:Zn(2)-C6 fungal-type domain-containing protein n=1 Tax=Clonostachys byssicola TaxID=160290 RepID=A0A9N9UQD5_9HYPO|nr:unnamed protein product [Clonostachys byssicola]
MPRLTIQNIRFRPTKTIPSGLQVSGSTREPASEKTTKICRSRHGCRECRRRKVKCDETRPVCSRCQKRGLVCFSDPHSPPSVWQLELPWIFAHASTDKVAQTSKPNSSLLQWWFDTACHIMVIDPQVNPLSYPMMEHITASESLLHAIQSISAAHRRFFDRDSRVDCLKERDQALQLVQAELGSKKVSLLASFFTIFILGISSPWIDESVQDYGLEHFLGARATLDIILSDPANWTDPTVRVITGYYLFWDMAIALLGEPLDLPALDTDDMSAIVESMQDYCHPIAGRSAKIFYLLGLVGRYVRRVMSDGKRDLFFEMNTEDALLVWEPTEVNTHVRSLCNSFRSQALILLYQVRSFSPLPLLEHQDHIEGQIHSHALSAVSQLLDTPVTQHCFNIQAIPLTVAASGLKSADSDLRQQVVTRLKAIYSTSRVRTILLATSLLEELWELHDAGVHITYVELMLSKNWKLTLV